MNYFRSSLLLSLCLVPGLISAQINDCPYIFINEKTAQIKWVEKGAVLQKEISTNEFGQLTINACSEFDASIIELNRLKTRDDSQAFSGVTKIAALSDIHGQFDLFIRLLKANSIIDSNGEWSFEDGHFVIVGDVFDRGDKVTETLWYLYQLEQQAMATGGAVHLLLGNHEIMVMNGDLRYVSDKYQKVAELMEMEYDELFSKNTLLGQWLRTKPVAITINNIAFSHAGFSPAFATKKFTIESTNRLFHELIIDRDKEFIAQNDSAYFLAKSDGPIWYRGYFRDENFTEDQLDTILEHLGKEHVVVGHTSMEKVESHFNGKLLSVDSSIKNGESGELLIWENDTFYRGNLNGEKLPLK